MRCEKCLMDPCLCHLDGFGSEEDETTTNKELEELMGKRCIVKTTFNGDKIFLKGIPDFKIAERGSDITGQIVKMQVIIDPTIDENHAELIDLHLDTEEENILPPGIHPLPIFYVKYDEPGPNNVPGHWYIDEEVIYL